MILTNGWQVYSTWSHCASVAELYAKRSADQIEEMVCHRQAVELLAPFVGKGETLLDVGCGSGYFFHSIRKRDISLDYYGIDAEASFIEIGRDKLAGFGLDPSHLMVSRIDDLNASVDHVVCINVLSNMDNYHRPLERLLHSAGKTLILRESIADEPSCHYVVDRFLDDGVELRIHVNTYRKSEIISFIKSYGFEVECFVDDYTGGKPQDVIGYPHHWMFIRAVKEKT